MEPNSVTFEKVRWSCQNCGESGEIEINNERRDLAYKLLIAHPHPNVIVKIEPPIFDPRSWATEQKPASSGDKHTWFGAGIPVAVMDEMTQYIFDTWSAAVEALVRAACSAHAKGWKP